MVFCSSLGQPDFTLFTSQDTSITTYVFLFREVSQLSLIVPGPGLVHLHRLKLVIALIGVFVLVPIRYGCVPLRQFLKNKGYMCDNF